jgi:hypothetical protein
VLGLSAVPASPPGTLAGRCADAASTDAGAPLSSGPTRHDDRPEPSMGTRSDSVHGYPIRDWAPPLFLPSFYGGNSAEHSPRGAGTGEPPVALREEETIHPMPESL